MNEGELVSPRRPALPSSTSSSSATRRRRFELLIAAANLLYVAGDDYCNNNASAKADETSWVESVTSTDKQVQGSISTAPDGSEKERPRHLRQRVTPDDLQDLEPTPANEASGHQNQKQQRMEGVTPFPQYEQVGARSPIVLGDPAVSHLPHSSLPMTPQNKPPASTEEQSSETAPSPAHQQTSSGARMELSEPWAQQQHQEEQSIVGVPPDASPCRNNSEHFDSLPLEQSGECEKGNREESKQPQRHQEEPSMRSLGAKLTRLPLTRRVTCTAGDMQHQSTQQDKSSLPVEPSLPADSGEATPAATPPPHPGRRTHSKAATAASGGAAGGGAREYFHYMMETDVLFFRGSRSHISPGTALYLKMVQRQRSEFGSTKSRKKKAECKRKIMDYMQRQGGARFIREEQGTGRYYRLTEREVLQAISHSLWYANFKKKTTRPTTASTTTTTTTPSSSCLPDESWG